jgi:uncharacterized protein (DUF488 family)
MPEKYLYTLGTDLRSIEDFIEILHSYDIRNYIDVRSFPKSKLPHFNKEALRDLLITNGIGYYYLGRELGGFRRGGYTAFIITNEFSNGIDHLESIANENLSVISCAEKFPWKCHRRWIARELQQRGWAVRHIIDKGKVWIPK